MTELLGVKLRDVGKGVLLGILLAAVLVGCSRSGDNNTAPEIALKVDQPTLQNGGLVTLTAEVLKGLVTSVTFQADKGDPIPPITEPNEAGDFVTQVTVTQTTNFTAVARGPSGTSKSTPAAQATVTVTNPQEPQAPAQTFTTYKDVPYLSGVTPTGLAATSDITVTGIKGSVEAATKTTTQGGKVTIVAGEDALAFTYTPKNLFTGTDTFDYTVKLGDSSATGTIEMNVVELPTNISLLSTLANIAETQKVGQTIVLTTTLDCKQSPCISLKDDQTLTGKIVTTDGITISSPTAGISTNIAGTRQPGTASGSGAETRVIELADNTSIKHLTFSGEGSSYFVAIYGAVYGGGNSFLEGNISIEDVVIQNANGKPIYFNCGSFPCNTTLDYPGYTLTINNLRLESAFDTLVIGVPGRLTFTNSTIDLRQPTVGSKAFGDNVGIDVVDLLSAPLTFDNVDIFMESPRKKLDNDPLDYSAVPVIITNNQPGTKTALKVANSDITFGDPDSNWSLSTVKSFKLKAISGAQINISADSVNNTSEATGNDVERDGTITGKIGGLE